MHCVYIVKCVRNTVCREVLMFRSNKNAQERITSWKETIETLFWYL